VQTLLIQPRVAPISKAPCTRDAVRSEARSFVAEALAAAPGYSAPSTAPPEVEKWKWKWKWKRKLQTALAMLPCELKPRLARVVLLAAKLPLVAAMKSPQGPMQLLPAVQLGAGEQPPVSQAEWGPQSWAELQLEDWAVSRLEPLQQAEPVLR